MRRAIMIGFMLTAPVAAPLAAQEPAVRETLTVRLLEVDVRVTDRDGNPVHGLEAGDFELFEDGRRKPITNFSEIRSTSAILAAAPGETRPQPEPSAPAVAPRTVVLFVDSLPFRGAARSRLFDQLRELTAGLLRAEAGDRAMVYAWTLRGAKPAVPLTDDPAAIEQGLNLLEEGGAMAGEGPSVDSQAAWFRDLEEASTAMIGGGIDAESQIETSVRASAEQVLARMRRKTAALRRIVSSLTSPEGKKILIYVSHEFTMNAAEQAAMGSRATVAEVSRLGNRGQFSTTNMLEDVVAAANASGVTFYAIRPEIPDTTGSFSTLEEEWDMSMEVDSGSVALRDTVALQNEVDALRLVTESTGGSVSVGPAGMAELAGRIERDLTSWYTLGWAGPPQGDDLERRIEVRVKDPGYRVYARKSLVEKSDLTRARDLLMARLFEQGTGGDIEFEIGKDALVPARRGTRLLPLHIRIPLAQLQFRPRGEKQVARLILMTVGGAGPGETSEITEQSTEITADANIGGDPEFVWDVQAVVHAATKAISIAILDEHSGLSGARTIDLDVDADRVTVREPVRDPRGADALWQAAREKSAAAGAPLVAFFRPKHCRVGLSNRDLCIELEQDALPHPAITRRLSSIAWVTLPPTEGDAAKLWKSKRPGLAYFDATGQLRARWDGVPDAGLLGIILDAIIAAAPHFDRSASVAAERGAVEGEIDAALGLATLGRRDEARVALERAAKEGSPRARDFAAIVHALLDAGDGRVDDAVAALERKSRDASDAVMSAEALVALAGLRKSRGETAEALAAYQRAGDIAPEGSGPARTAAAGIESLGGNRRERPFRILPFDGAVSGPTEIRTAVSSIAVARVQFFLDGFPTAEAGNPPFTAMADLGRIPGRHTIRAVAYDPEGREVARDEISVNDSEDAFWIRLVKPEGANASGPVAVETALGAPRGSAVETVRLEWNERTVATLEGEPWRATVAIPGEVGILRAVATLADGRTTEDAVLLNAPGYVERAEVRLLEVPVTLRGPTAINASALEVRGAGTRPVLEALLGPDEAPLTIGIVLDSSASIQPVLPDLQAAAMRFLERTLTGNARAFLITFDSQARLVQAPTEDRPLLEKRILSIRPAGLTALNDAIVLGLLQFQGVRGRRALVVFSDGVDRTSRYRSIDAAELARKMGVPVHVIASQPEFRNLITAPAGAIATPTRAGRPSVPPVPSGVTAQRDRLVAWRGELGTIARPTGGGLHVLQTLDDLGEIYDTIAAAIAQQRVAVLRVDPAIRDNEWRPIEIRSTERGVTVLAPEGYYAPR